MVNNKISTFSTVIKQYTIPELLQIERERENLIWQWISENNSSESASLFAFSNTQKHKSKYSVIIIHSSLQIFPIRKSPHFRFIIIYYHSLNQIPWHFDQRISNSLQVTHSNQKSNTPCIYICVCKVIFSFCIHVCVSVQLLVYKFSSR